MTGKQQPWQLLVLMGTGVFFASFWILFGLLTVLGTQAAWWQYVASLAPGAAMLAFVLMARRAPLPYGTGMIVLGLFFVIHAWLRQVSVLGAVFLGVPLVVLGGLFILARKKIARWHEN